MKSYIIDGIRTPIGKLRGSLSTMRADDILAQCIKELKKRNPNIDFDNINDVIIGCANQAGEDNRNIARMSLLLAGLSSKVPGETINRLCASSMSAVALVQRAISNNDGELFIAGGVEQMTRAPFVISKSSNPFGGDAKIYDTTFGWRFINPAMNQMYGTDSMGETAENLVDKYKISRERQDKFALWSQHKAINANKLGRFAKEILPIEIKGKNNIEIFDKDEFIRYDANMDSMSKLKPSFRNNGTVTAGNSSGLNDGAGVLLIASELALEKYNLKPLAEIVSNGSAGVEPRIMGIGPVEASKIALQKANLTLEDIDIIEINEAFGAQVLACTQYWGLDDNDPRINPNGGAIALGHPLGMSGMRLIQTASIELQIQNKKYALCTMCIGVGQGYAIILKNPNLT